MTGLSPEAIRRGFARERRQPWESLWRACYAYALPQRGLGLGAEFAPTRRYSDGLFDGEDRAALAGYLEDMADRVRRHFERSSFAVEIHQ